MYRKRSSSRVSITVTYNNSDTGSTELPSIKRSVTNRTVQLIKTDAKKQPIDLVLPPLMEPAVHRGIIIQ